MEAIKRKFKPQPAEIINEGIIGGLSAGVINSILRLFTDNYVPPFSLHFYEGREGILRAILRLFSHVFSYVLNLLPAVAVGLVLAAIYIGITRAFDSVLSRRLAWLAAVAAFAITLLTPLSPYIFEGSPIIRVLMLAVVAILPTFTFTSNT